MNSLSPDIAPYVIVFDVTAKYIWVHGVVGGADEKLVQQCLDGDIEVATEVLPLSVILFISLFWRWTGLVCAPGDGQDKWDFLAFSARRLGRHRRIQDRVHTCLVDTEAHRM